MPPDAALTTTKAEPPSAARLPSIRMLITLIVVIPIAAVSALLIAITTVSSNRIAEQLGREIVINTPAQVSTDVHNYLGAAVRLSDLYARRVLDGSLRPTDLAGWEQTMFQDLAVNPDVASICFATMDGDCTWLLHAHDRIELGLVHANAKDRAIEFPADSAGNVDRSKPIRVYHYDATSRPWFQTALSAKQAMWTPIYFWFGQGGAASETGSGYTRVLHDRAGKPVGVLVIDVTLGALSSHLRQMPIARNGYAFIVDELGLLVAASHGRVNSVSGERLTPGNSDNVAARAGASVIRIVSTTGPTNDGESAQSSRIDLDGRPARAQATPLKPYPGIRWQVLTVLPESTFLAHAQSVQRRAIILAACAIVGGLILGFYLSRRLSEPLVQLSAHVGRIGAGDFDSRLHLRNAAELRNASDELNKMAVALKERMKLEQALAVAEQVQQSLLPGKLPTIAGVELAACIEYCDSTGGDYYDFIEILGSSGSSSANDGGARPKETMLVVGDVSGHGIGPALLMASARGTLRTSAHSATSLGQILTSANRALAGNAGDLFMTMSITSIDPATRTIRWASAGHDPPIVYHPDTDTFDELDAGNFPLCVVPDFEFEEFSRPVATPGSIMFVGTDGIWEARNAQGELFGKERLRDLIRRNASTADALAKAIQAALAEFTTGAAIADDVTFVIAKIV